MNQKEKEEMTGRLTAAGETAIFKTLERLPQKQQTALYQQLAAIDPGRLAALKQTLGKPPCRKSTEKIEPAPVKHLPAGGSGSEDETGALNAGRKALEDDRVAALTVAGGQGTRLGFEGPKGAFPITPIRGKSLFQYLGEKICAARKRYRCRMPWLVMTSHANDRETQRFFEQNRYFEMEPASVRFFRQNWNPILDREGNLAVDENANLLLGPDGHGGVFEALHSAGMTEYLKTAGLDLISYFQVDNPLVNVADERFLGHHILENADFSCKVIEKRDPFEGLGVAVLKDNKPAVVEYIDMTEDMAKEKNHDGQLKYRFGSIAVHVINTEFAEKMAFNAETMPWHVAGKNYNVRDTDGNVNERTCYKFEKFVFDSLPHARGCVFVETGRRNEFAPVKNARGADSPSECRKMLQEKWLRQIKQSGIDLQLSAGGEITVEISPLSMLHCNRPALK